MSPAGRESARRKPDTRRHGLILLLFAVAFTLIAVKLLWLQVINASAYAEKATAQRMRDIELPARRGTLYDREGEPLAVSVEARTIYAAPNQIEDKRGAAKILAETLGGNEADYLAKLERNNGFVYIARKVDLARAKELESRISTGVGYTDDYRRVYPSGELACQVLGFVGVEDQGLAGLEAEYDDLLKGTPGVMLGERDPSERPIPGGIQKEIEPVHGLDVVLTIDKDIQYEAQLGIAKAVKEWKAKSGSIIVMNPRNGELYAMATAPGFNPNDFGKAKPDATRNRPLTDAYEPGSTMKCLTSSTAIERGVCTPDTMFNLPSTLRVGGSTIHESHGRGAVRWSLTDIVTQSSNVGTVLVGKKLGEKRLYNGLKAFGLCETPGTDFPGTIKGYLPPVAQWSATSIGNIPFGQGVSVTPVQMARAVSAIANEGVLTTPHFLLDVPDSDRQPTVWETRRAISASTASAVTTMLAAVITEGTGSLAAVPGYTVAGKTGTAQKVRSDGRGYKGGGYVGSFIGFLPAEDPQVLVFVLLDQPANAIYGGTVAAPTFSKVAQFTVAHLKIPPSSNPASLPADPGVGQVSHTTSKD